MHGVFFFIFIEDGLLFINNKKGKVVPAGQVHAPCIHDQLHQLQADPWFLNAQLLQLECRSEYCLIGSGLWYYLQSSVNIFTLLIGYGPQARWEKKGKKKEDLVKQWFEPRAAHEQRVLCLGGFTVRNVYDCITQSFNPRKEKLLVRAPLNEHSYNS